MCRRGADQRLEPGEDCPAARECYPDDWCGQSVQCVKYVDDATCTESPTCDAEQLTVQACIAGGVCETRVACGKSVMCETLKPGCLPGFDKDRVFAALLEGCESISIHCSPGSKPFVDDCGCGCEQPSECPDAVNCGPSTGEARSELCDSAECPFTERPQ